ncbi:MAG: hypothetical protein K9N47_05490 [Prosthecobacter sp.]|nr:hypothetical protein [Prosthecobacter sp.]
MTALDPNIVLGGGATATWTAITATHGTLDIHFPPGRFCPGGDPEAEIDPYASCSLKFRGCGTLHVTAAGTGGAVDGTPVASSLLTLRDGVTLSVQPSIQMVSGSGGVSCDSAGLTGDDDVTFKVGCGTELILAFDGTGATTAPACDITFDIEVDA